VRLDLLAYQQGLYRARFVLAVQPAGRGPQAAARIEAEMRHGLLGVRASATVHPATLAWKDLLPGLDLSLTPAGLSVVAEPRATAVSLGLEGLTLSTRPGASSLPPLSVVASAVRLQARFREGREGLAAALELAAEQIESRGVPYVRLTGVRGSAAGTLAPLGTASLRVQADSNYGELRARVSLPGPAAGDASDAELEVDAPAGLARLLLARDPRLADRWRRAGALQDTGPRVSLRLRGPVGPGLF
jgi:hypothetical protein